MQETGLSLVDCKSNSTNSDPGRLLHFYGISWLKKRAIVTKEEKDLCLIHSDLSPVPSGVASQASVVGKSVVRRAGEYRKVEGLIQGIGLLVAGAPEVNPVGDSLLASGESIRAEFWDPPSPP